MCFTKSTKPLTVLLQLTIIDRCQNEMHRGGTVVPVTVPTDRFQQRVMPFATPLDPDGRHCNILASGIYCNFLATARQYS